jgi:hypothetical protein
VTRQTGPGDELRHPLGSRSDAIGQAIDALFAFFAKLRED